MNKKVAIILINYKSYAKLFLQESYDSLLNLNYPKENYCIYIVDNCSSKKSRKTIKKIAPNAKLIPSNGNGWGHGNNMGAKMATEDGFDDFFFFVNMDTAFDKNFLTEAIKTAINNKAGIVQSKILLYKKNKGEYMLNSKGNKITYLGFSYSAGDGKVDDTSNKEVEINTASGVGLLISKDVFSKINGCDEEYFMYQDDVELSFKVKLLGLKLFLAPKSIIYHKHEFERSIKMIYYIERNRIKFLLEFYKIKTLLLVFPAFIFMEIGMMPYVILNKWFLTKMKAYLFFLSPLNILKIIKKRKFIQKLRTINDKEMMSEMVGVIEFQQIDNFVLKHIANPAFKLYWKIIKKIV